MSEPWKPADYEPADISAIQALERGKADEIQQRRALQWIINNACGTYEATFYPGEAGQRDSDFSNGKRHVGLSIVKMLKLNPAKVVEIDQTRRKDNV